MFFNQQILALGLLHYNRKYGMRTSGLLWMFWLLLSLCGIVQYRSLLRKNEVWIILKYYFKIMTKAV